MFENKIKIKSLLSALLVLIVVLSPLILWLFLTKGMPTHFITSATYGDEVEYYRLPFSWSKYHNYGYYGVSKNGEVHSNIGSFTAHGPMYTLFYGLWAKIFGWEQYSIILSNVIVLIIALFFLVQHYQNKKKFLLPILMYGYFPLVCFLATGMVETIQYTLMIFTVLILDKAMKEVNTKNLVLAYSWAIFLMLFRINYCVFFLLVCLLRKDDLFKKIIIWIVCTVVTFLVSTQFSAPYPNYLTRLIKGLMAGKIITSLRSVVIHMGVNIKDYFALQTSWFSTVFRYSYIFILLYLLITLFVKKNKENVSVTLFCTLVLLSQWFILIILYETQLYKAERTLAPILFFVFLTWIISNENILYEVILITFAVLGLITTKGYSSFVSQTLIQINVSKMTYTMQSDTAEICQHLVYDSDGNHWNNTMVLGIDKMYDYDIYMGLPAYIGFNYIIKDDFSNVEKSKYILADYDNYNTVNLAKYRKVCTNDLGILFERK